MLVGHSYGGAVITNAGTGNPNVKSLVYIAAYALAEGESLAAGEQPRRRAHRPGRPPGLPALPRRGSR